MASARHLDDSELRLLQDSVDEKYTFNSTIASVFAHADAFLIGFRSDSIIPSAINCSSNVEHSIYVINDTKVEWQKNSTDFKDKLFGTTYWISYSLAPSTDNCFGSFIEVYEFSVNQAAKFSGMGAWVAALVQNLLANVNSITQIQEKMTAASQSNDTIAL